MTCGFCLSAEAAITKSVSTSYFIERYGSSNFPYAWIISMPFNLLLVGAYNLWIHRLGASRMLFLAIFVTISLYSWCIVSIDTNYYLPCILYVSKEVLVMFLFHNLWSTLHATIAFDKAKYLYGIFFGFGGLGSVFGGHIVRQYAFLGSVNLLYFTFPLYLITVLCFEKGSCLREKMEDLPSISFQKGRKSPFYGAKLILSSSLLLYIFFFVVCEQTTSTLVEYQFHKELQGVYPDLDLRTKLLGSVLSVINIVNVCMQFVGAYVFIRAVGVLRLYLALPLLISLKLVLYLVFPSFALLTWTYGVVKAIDYSIFGILTGMLYIPLGVEEKFYGKSFISVFAYRGSKFIASFVALSLIFIPYLFLFLGVWIFLAWALYKNYFTLYQERKNDYRIYGKDGKIGKSSGDPTEKIIGQAQK